MTSLILPTDNAVIDYSIINQIINAVNLQQQTINNLVNGLASTKNGDGSVSVIKTAGGIQKPASGTTSKSFVVKLPISGMTKLTSIVATPYSPSGSALAYCWISSQNDTQVTFSTNVAVGAIYWIAIGTA
jgi:hypothetical protein